MVQKRRNQLWGLIITILIHALWKAWSRVGFRWSITFLLEFLQLQNWKKSGGWLMNLSDKQNLRQDRDHVARVKTGFKIGSEQGLWEKEEEVVIWVKIYSVVCWWKLASASIVLAFHTFTVWNRVLVEFTHLLNRSGSVFVSAINVLFLTWRKKLYQLFSCN